MRAVTAREGATSRLTDQHRSGAEPMAIKPLVLGGGAVVRECFAPALKELGLLNRITIVEPRGLSFPCPANVIATDFGQVLSAIRPGEFSHCVIALPNAL